MPHKRTAAAADAHDGDGDAFQCHSSPRKRSRKDSFPYPRTPGPSGSSSSPNKASIFATPKTPYTPYPLHASDSPSNPFGRKRTERLIHTLPPVSSFSKHAVLRFQLVRKGVLAKQGGVYRIVRVPMNYTFTHLRCLIAWLFHTPASYAHANNEEYLFEVKSKVATYSPLYKPGQIKSGVTSVKLSNKRDPARWRSNYGLLDEEDELSEDGGEEVEKASDIGTEDAEEDEADEWRWADEEDFTLGHVFPRGIDAEIAIVYHHSPSTQIHITVNKAVLPRQRGRANTPFVFHGRGRVHLSPPPLPRPVFTKSISDILSSSPAPIAVASSSNGSPTFQLSRAVSTPQRRLTPPKDADWDDDADGDIDPDVEGGFLHPFDENHPFFHASSSPVKHEVILVEDSDDDGKDDDEENGADEDHDEEIVPDKWNIPSHLFALYLLQYMDPHGTDYGDVDESFFQEEQVYDPFDDDDDDDVPVEEDAKKKKTPIPVQQEQEEEEEETEFDIFEDAQCDEDEEDIAGEGADERDEEEDLAYAEEEEYEDYQDEDGFIEVEEDLKGQDTQSSTPGLTHCASSSSSLPPSSPQRHPSSPAHSSYYGSANASSLSLPDPSDFDFILEAHYPNKKYTQTPAPPKARKFRLRIKRLEKQLAKLKKSAFMTKHDEKVEEDEETPKEPEVDELAGDNGAETEVQEEEDQEAKERDYDARLKWRKPSSKSGEIWDPFGDEVEL
uniref:Uncharacterized protein n=1 Tax=Psilocybe cubensis TaxID=181762 RepID=A0A8H8CGY9_PSICU